MQSHIISNSTFFCILLYLGSMPLFGHGRMATFVVANWIVEDVSCFRYIIYKCNILEHSEQLHNAECFRSIVRSWRMFFSRIGSPSGSTAQLLVVTMQCFGVYIYIWVRNCMLIIQWIENNGNGRTIHSGKYSANVRHCVGAFDVPMNAIAEIYTPKKIERDKVRKRLALITIIPSKRSPHTHWKAFNIIIIIIVEHHNIIV